MEGKGWSRWRKEGDSILRESGPRSDTSWVQVRSACRGFLYWRCSPVPWCDTGCGWSRAPRGRCAERTSVAHRHGTRGMDREAWVSVRGKLTWLEWSKYSIAVLHQAKINWKFSRVNFETSYFIEYFSSKRLFHNKFKKKERVERKLTKRSLLYMVI